VSIYSFPMKCHPIRRTTDMGEDYSHNRDYIGKYWNRKYIRAIQAVLNSTKGKIGKGTSFFRKAFGENIEEYHKLLEIPETMIIYRYFFEWLGLENGGKKMTIEILGNDSICNASTHSWWKAFCDCKKCITRRMGNDIEYYFNKSVDKYINLTNRLLRRFYRGFSNDLENVRNSLLCVIILSNNPCQKQR
jgi:hypothetical protein